MLESFVNTVLAQCTVLTLVILRLSIRSRPESVQFHPENQFSPRLISEQPRKGCSKWTFLRSFFIRFCVDFLPPFWIYIYRVSQEEWTKLRESTPYVKICRYNPKHLCPKLNGYGDNGQRKVWTSLGFHALYLPADSLMHARPSVRYHITAYAISKLHTFRLMR
jgi:hypothetical protein